MYERILTYLNIALIVLCGIAIWYLSTETYTKPREIRLAEMQLEHMEVETGWTESNDE